MNTKGEKILKQPERGKIDLKGMAITLKADFSIAIMEVRSQDHILIY